MRNSEEEKRKEGMATGREEKKKRVRGKGREVERV